MGCKDARVKDSCHSGHIGFVGVEFLGIPDKMSCKDARVKDSCHSGHIGFGGVEFLGIHDKMGCKDARVKVNSLEFMIKWVAKMQG